MHWLRRCASPDCPNEPGVSPRSLWRTRGPVNLGGGPHPLSRAFEAEGPGSRKLSYSVVGEAHSKRSLSLPHAKGPYPPCPITQNATAPNTAAATGASNATAIIAKKLKSVPAVAIAECPFLSSPFQNVRGRLRVPLPTACRWDAPSIQRVGNLTKRARTGLLCFPYDGQHVRRVPIRFG